MLKKSIIGLVIIGLVGCGYFGYSFYRDYQIAEQQRLLLEAEERMAKSLVNAKLKAQEARKKDLEQAQNREKRIQDGTATVEKIIKRGPSGQILEEYTLVDGKKEGSYLVWRENGRKYGEWNYKNGVQDGIQLTYHDSKKNSVVFEEPYDNGRRVGDHYWWYEDGTLKCHEFFAMDNAEQKNWKTCWFPNGKIKSDKRFNTETKLVDFIQWHENEQMKSIYSEGYSAEKRAIISNSKGWYEDGQPEQDFNVVNRQFDGWNREWDKDGQLITNEYWSDGIIDREKTDPKYIRTEYRLGRR